MKTILYARVSTREQTAAHQLTQAQAAGFAIDEVVTDEGVSGVTTRLAERPQGRRLFDMLRAGDTLLVRWVDRLGRDYGDVSDTIREFMRRGVVVRTVVNGMVFDGSTKDPMQQAVRDALIAFMAALSQAQAEAMKEARRAGIAHAKAQPGASQKFRGRKPSYTRAQFEVAQKMLGEGQGLTAVSEATGITRPSLWRIKADPAACAAALEAWGL
ncbi:Resolvase/integrase Bin [Rhodobacter sp. AKP1]|nr:Resolvase/integrase Bin [Rhodobacter sp. AKP1]